MRGIQEIFDQIQELKQVRKEINREYRDALVQAEGYEDLKEEVKTMREKKKFKEDQVRASLGAHWGKFEDATTKIAELEQMLTDIAMTTLMDGNSINLKDKNDVEYEPSYKITFKKIQ